MANVKQSLMCSVRFSKTTGYIYKKNKIKLNSEWKHPPPVIIIKLKIDNTFVFPVWVRINSTDCDVRSLFQYLANSFSITLQYGDGY